MDSFTIDYGGIMVGSVVVLGRHREVEGYDNWTPEMDEYVGMQATVTQLDGVDGSGCPTVHVDADDSNYSWRIRDFGLP